MGSKDNCDPKLCQQKKKLYPDIKKKKKKNNKANKQTQNPKATILFPAAENKVIIFLLTFHWIIQENYSY